MSLSSQITDLATAIGQKIKAVQVHQIATSIPLDPLTTGVGIVQLVAMRNCTIVGIRATCAVGKAPTGADVILDVNKNGTTLFTTQGNRPKVTATNTIGALATPDVTTWNAGDVLTIDVDQIGSTLAGSLVTVTIGVY